MSADSLRAALVELHVPVIANHVQDTPLGSIDWAGVAAELGREPTAAEITRAWLAMGQVDGWAAG